MSCQYKDQCPSYSGWCEGPKQDFSRCLEFLISAYENEKKRNDSRKQKLFRDAVTTLFSTAGTVTITFKRSSDV